MTFDKLHLSSDAGDMTWLAGQLDERGIKTRDLAKELDVTTQTVYDWRNGKQQPKDHHAAALADALDVSETEIRRQLGLWVPDDLTEEQAQLTLAAIRRRIAILEQTAKTERERDVLEQLRELVDSPDEVDEPG